MVKVLIVLLLLLSGCSGLKTIGSLLPNSGTQVAASVQLGKTNSKTVGQTNFKEQTIKNATAETIVQDSSSSRVNSDRVEQVVVNEGVPFWAVALLVVTALSLGLSLVDNIQRWIKWLRN